MTRCRWPLLFLIPPLIALGLWLGSGREHLTKQTKFVEVRMHDELFGEAIEHRYLRGRIGGYFIGLDAVAVTTLVCGLLAGVSWYVTCRRSKKATPTERASDAS